MGWVWAQLEPNLILLGGRKRDSLLTEESKHIGLSQLAMLADQFWLNKVKMVTKEMAVDLAGDHKISTNMDKVLGGDGFSWSDQVESILEEETHQLRVLKVDSHCQPLKLDRSWVDSWMLKCLLQIQGGKTKKQLYFTTLN